MSFKTYRLNDDVVSFAFKRYVSLRDMANTSETYLTKNYNLASGQSYQLSDIFTGKYLEALSAKALAALKNRDDFTDNNRHASLELGLAAKPENFERFVLSGDEIIFYFNRYQLGPRDISPQQFQLKLGDMSDYLQPNFKSSTHSTAKPTPPEHQSPIAENPSPPATQDLANKKLIALTFDDGPNPATTNRLLDILKSENVVATFFVLGSRTDYYPQIVKRAYLDGHAIASHTYNHLNLVNLSPADRQAETNNTVTAIKNATGAAPRLMRPPYGSYNSTVLADAGMPIALWSVDPEDWRYRDSAVVTNSVLTRVQDGDIVLLHDIYDTSVNAASQIIPALKGQSYTFVTVEQLILSRGGSLASGGVFSNMRL
jgi:peptidoglycan/xylan/chitin deacetylase (PgdA/CDA1 family)